MIIVTTPTLLLPPYSYSLIDCFGSFYSSNTNKPPFHRAVTFNISHIHPNTHIQIQMRIKHINDQKIHKIK